MGLGILPKFFEDTKQKTKKNYAVIFENVKNENYF